MKQRARTSSPVPFILCPVLVHKAPLAVLQVVLPAAAVLLTIREVDRLVLAALVGLKEAQGADVAFAWRRIRGQPTLCSQRMLGHKRDTELAAVRQPVRSCKAAGLYAW